MNDRSCSVGDEFKLEIEELNIHDGYDMSIKVSNDILGHVGFLKRSLDIEK